MIIEKIVLDYPSGVLLGSMLILAVVCIYEYWNRG